MDYWRGSLRLADPVDPDCRLYPASDMPWSHTGRSLRTRDNVRFGLVKCMRARCSRLSCAPSAWQRSLAC